MTTTRVGMAATIIDDDDILRSFIEYHHRLGVDAFSIWVMSASPDAIAWLEGAGRDYGVRIHSIDANQDVANSFRRNHLAADLHDREHCDWVIHTDVDEFWHLQSGDLHGLLNSYEAQGGRSISCKRYNRVAERAYMSDSRPPELANYRYRVHDPLGKYFEERLENPDIDWHMCKVSEKSINHITNREPIMLGGHPAPNVAGRIDADPSDLYVDHFAFRSLQEFRSKVGHIEAFFAANTLPERIAYHWRIWLDAYKQGRLEAIYETCFPTQNELDAWIQQGRIEPVTSGPFSS